MSETAARAAPLSLLPALVTLWGHVGKLEPVGETAITDENLVGADGCWVWRTGGSLQRSAGARRSLLALACDVAELYHQRHALYLSDVPGAALEVIWLELAADNSLLVFLKPVVQTTY